MARFAVLCVLFACFAVAVYSQTCDPQTGLWSNVASRAIVVDATGVANVKGVLNIADGSGTLGLDYQKNQGFAVTKVPGTVTVKRTPPKVDSAHQLGGVSVIVTLGLAALALVSQRGSLVALVLALAVATVVIAGCASVSTLEVTVAIDPAQLDKFTLRLWLDPVTKACPPAGFSLAGALATSTEVTTGINAAACEIVWNNPLVGCKRCPAIANQQSVSCNAGQCAYVCDATHQLCGGNCDIALNDPTNCGACGVDCSANVTGVNASVCSVNGCSYDQCLPGRADCDGNAANGCEADVSAPAACGSCKNDCTAYANIDMSTVTCANGACNFTCLAGKLDCSGSTDGCESSDSADTTCGACDNDCTSTVGTHAPAGTCNPTTHQCVYPSCDAGFADCTNSIGCETPITSDSGNCGACGFNCGSLPNVQLGATCVNSVCVIACLDGFGDCDGNVTNGCEARLDTATACGSCSKVCPGASMNVVNPVCSNGTCDGQCATGFAQCDPTAAIGTVGCPNDVSSDAANCGLCGNTCPNVKNAVVACSANNCTYATCNAGFQDCDGNKANGCESTIATDKNNCGGCGSAFNCEVSGAAGNFASATCANSLCSFSCQGGFSNCDGLFTNGCEANIFTDVNNCNGCGTACALPNAAIQSCIAGVCQADNCTAPFAYCGTANPNTVGCTINLSSDPLNCNACGNSCAALPNVDTNTITCASGVCTPATHCLAGYNDCDGNVANGCELPVSICTPTAGQIGTGVCSVAHGYTTPTYNGFDCKSLGATQNVDTANTYCASSNNSANGAVVGTCFITCLPGFQDCNGNPTDGCENPAANCGSALTSGSCNTALKDPLGPVSCTALSTDPTLNVTVVQGGSNNVCNTANGLCTYTCAAGHFDCDNSAKNGCEIDTRICPTASAADCVFNNNSRCGYGICADCSILSGTRAPGTCSSSTINGTLVSQCSLDCNASLCQNADGNWANGCEMAQGYLGTVGVGLVDCSKDVDLTNILIVNFQPVACDGNSSSPFAGKCGFTCKPGFRDCDGSPFNGCETEMGGACTTCDYQADVSCGKNKCVDCTLLPGTLGTDYANGRWAAASASTCLQLNVGNERITDFVCDTSVHRLNPRFDPPSGDNGACQSELCRDLDGDWANGCESAQQYGRGRFYFYGDSTLLDSYLVPYVPNPYEDRFYDYKEDFTAVDIGAGGSPPLPLLNPIVDDIKILKLLKASDANYPFRANLLWKVVVGYAAAPETYAAPMFAFPYPSFQSDPTAIPASYAVSSSVLSGLEIALLHYAPYSFTEVDEPSEAADLAIIGEPYTTPVDCVLSEWSDWGLCTYADDCITKDYVLMTRIRTRKVVTPASGGGVCHLPLVEDFYRFSHRNSNPNNIEFISGFPWVADATMNTNAGNSGADVNHGGGFGYRIDYTKGYTAGTVTFDIMKILHFNAKDWIVTNTYDPAVPYTVNNAQDLSWTGVEQYGTNNASADLASPKPDQYGLLLTCVTVGSCPDTNLPGNFPIACNVSAWSAWSACSASCDGDWAGGVRIRTRTVIVAAARKGECFVSEFDAVTGLPLIPNAGMLYEEDWQCNDHSCSSYDCNQLKVPAFAASVHIDLSADKISPKCDGRDWPSYVNGMAWVDVNRDGRDDNALYQLRGPSGDQEWFEVGGNFPLFRTIYNFSYEYRWPGHCLYECVEGWFDCDHDPRNGCETSGDFCSVDVEFGSPTQLKHPLLPWEHPHGECTIAWKHDASGVVPRDCTNFNQQYDSLRHTTGVCSPLTGFCDLTCDDKYFNCNGDGCVRIDETDGFCGKNCVKCDQLNLFKYGYQSAAPWSCIENAAMTDFECKPTTTCQPGCSDDDGDLYNGCETAEYKQWPYPDVTPVMTEMDQWSSWTACSHSDDCGFLWDRTASLSEGVFRNVPIQTRYRRPTKSAYNGGAYPDFKYSGRTALKIEGVSFPTDFDFQYVIGYAPALKDVRGVPLVQTPFYEVRVCDQSVGIAPCIECTNQLVGLEEHCQLSAWSDWSACSAECIDRVFDPIGTNTDPAAVNTPHFMWDLSASNPARNAWVTDRLPYQIRTRAVVQAARRGGRCPPPGDTWQITEAISNVRIASTTTFYPDMSAGGLADSLNNNNDMSAKASYLVDVRKCNTDDCMYPEDCDALNYWYPGHFETVSTCATSTTFGENSRCVANTGFVGVDGCDFSNGYCDTVNGDLRDGCDTFVYATHCGRTKNTQECDYDNFFDCTVLPGVVSAYAAPCVIDPVTTGGDVTFVDMNSPSTENAPHICDIRWACNSTLCTNEKYASRTGAQLPLDWKDGCEVARNYHYPFVTVKSNVVGAAYTIFDSVATYTGTSGNPLATLFSYAVSQGAQAATADNANNEGNIIMNTFWDTRNKYTLDAPVSTDNSIEFSFDCRGYLFSNNFCGAGNTLVSQPVVAGGLIKDEDGLVVSSYQFNAGCHLSGKDASNAFYDLGFGCNGAWNTANAGMCVMNCAAGYYDADLDPRNGCETDTIDAATPEDKYVWVGNCQATNNAVTITSDNSCGADKCVNCRALPGTLTTGTAGTQVPSCLLAEEKADKIPVLAKPSDYYSIQYGCGILSANTNPIYNGLVDFNNRFCNDKCADGDSDWRNGCEQGRGYTGGAAGYVMGGVYDALFDRVLYATANDVACNADFTLTSGTPCDKRSSGFEFPIPGAWFYENLSIAVGDNNNYGQLTSPAFDLTNHLSKLNGVANLYASVEDLTKPLVVTAKRAFDCSLLYSTELLYGVAGSGVPADQIIHDKYTYLGRVSASLWTFAQVHHIDTTKPAFGVWNNVCNRTTGLCNYVCQSGWDDYDLDPSNGCEADLSGPCGTPTARVARSYYAPASCGPECVDCRVLPGSYQLPIPKSECLAIYPEYFLNSPPAKHDHVIATVRFVHTCSTEVIKPQANDNSTAWQNIVCDPTLCYDANFDYEDGCELAVNYPKNFLGLVGGLRKASFNHWLSPIPDGTGAHVYAETTYWLRDDGLVVIGRGKSVAPPTATLGDNWVALFDLQATKGGEGFAYYATSATTVSATEKFDFYFRKWDLRNLYNYNTKKWYTYNGADGYSIFPFVDITAAYDCSNAMVPSGEDVVINVGAATTVNVDWTLTSSMDGPWFHVSQSSVSQCNPGYDPGAIRNVYGRGSFTINPLDYCKISAANATAWADTAYSKPCYDAWVWPGAGLCKLACEANWTDGDMDPTNGCESYMPNGLPYPNSKCGLGFNNPAIDVNFPNGKYNYNQGGFCGAGVCLTCRDLGGVNHVATAPPNVADLGGMLSTCIDGGDDWVAADASAMTAPVTGAVKTLSQATKYPGDYYCTGIINELSCLRTQLGIKCTFDALICPNNFLWAKTPIANNGAAGTQTSQTGAGYLQVCSDRDDQWETGCEIALGYNLDLTTTAPATLPGTAGTFTWNTATGITTVRGLYKRTIGVKPNWDNSFKVIDWTTLSTGASPLAGFDCEILRLLPPFHTHVTPQTATSNVIECSLTGKAGAGTCSFSCDASWSDCDKNPWNGCEQSNLLCGGTAGACQVAQRYASSLSCTSANIPLNEIARSTFCDGNQMPFDDWHLYYETAGSSNWNDASYYDAPFDIQDWGIDSVTIQTDYVDPVISRYTIKGLWDNADVDYVCRVWLDSYTVTGVTLRTNNISADSNVANGRCVVDCKESAGYSNCDNNDFNGCEPHIQDQSCRTTEGTCINCATIPGIVDPALLTAKCLSTRGVPAVDIQNFTITWQPNAYGIIGAVNYVVKYGNIGSLPPIGTQYPQCDTRGESALGSRIGQACDDFLCRDYDGDWENGCEFPMAYTTAQRALWETQQATYTGDSNLSPYDGFDCSWIADPQPDAGGRNYGGMTWAQKYHVNTDVQNGGSLGSCIGDENLANAGKCDIICAAGWSDCDADPSNGCETDNTLCGSCVFALKYPDGVPVNCSSLTDSSKGFIPFTIAPTCNGREGQDGQCSRYMCNIFNGSCDSGLGRILTTSGCILQTADDTYCGADWNWRDIRGNETTLPVTTTAAYDGGRMVDYGNFDGTGRCGTCDDLDGYVSPSAYCAKDAPVAGHTFDKKVYYKPAASGWIDNSLGHIEFDTAGNTVGEYLCQLHAVLDSGDDGACDRNLCVDEDYYWANGCETAVNYPIDLLAMASAGAQRHIPSTGADFGFDYHFAFNDVVYGRNWPHNAARDGVQTSDSLRSQVRGVWCPFLQFWSLSTDNYETGDCDVFPCPHFDKATITTWITCVNNATAANAGKCNFQCNLADGWKDCDMDPMTGCETDIFNDGTCGSGCERVECNALDGLNPFYWSECLGINSTSKCDLSICDPTLCKDMDPDWTNGCETAMNYPNGQSYNCRSLMAPSEKARLHLATVEPCNGEPGNHWAGKCEFTCEHGWIDCDGDFANGCEHDGSLCQDCTKALGYVTYYDGADFWQFWGPAVGSDMFYNVVYGSYFIQNTIKFTDYSLKVNSFDSSDAKNRNLDQFGGPNVAYSKYHVPYVAAFDCDDLRVIYPDHFTAAPITCDANVASATAGRCVYVCDSSKGYYDCDGDPRNGCEHESMHESCGSAGACRNCYYISGVDYPVNKDGDVANINDGSRGPYGRGGVGAFSDSAVANDVYDDVQVKYFSIDGTPTNVPSAARSPLRLGCVRPLGQSQYTCNLDTCVVQGATVCQDANQGILGQFAWRDGCERALGYDFNSSAAGKYFDCSLMGPDVSNNDAPRPTNIPNTPSFHVRQKVGTVGCDGQLIAATHPDTTIRGKGAWRYILAATGRQTGETQGRYAFDYDGLAELFMINFDLTPAQTLSDLALTVSNFVINRVRGSDKAGTCYYECEYGYEDCNGDPRDGCEIKISACRDGDGEFGWDWVNKVATNGCEVALGYTRAQLQITDSSIVPTFPCTNLATMTNVNISMPIYCRAGQDGNTADGTCQFTCAQGFQDCDGSPTNGCETPVSDTKCGCVDCTKLPGTMAQSTNPNDGLFAVSQSTCTVATLQCSVPCNDTLCSDGDGNWLNGCEVAKGYGTPRGATAVGPFNCTTWANDLLLAKKQHIDINLLGNIFCEGRTNAPGAGTCSYQAACINRANGGFNDYQDCNGDPRDGCEDTQRWCQVGDSAVSSTVTLSDKCSKAANYYRDPLGFDLRGQLVDGGASKDIPSFDCFSLGTMAGAHVNVSAVYPYCDRDATHTETRGDCVFICNAGWADCDGLATNGCEANITKDATCNNDCINCLTLSGIDRLAPKGCIADVTAGPDEYRCQFSCTGDSTSGCIDKDAKWQNGCERAVNGDIDLDGIFVNQGDFMDCSVMSDEAQANPALFRHHLHIDLSVPVPTALGNLPAGTIFCNNDLVTTAPFGKCFFMCLPGFVNTDRNSYNGCEAESAPAANPYVATAPAPPAANSYQFLIPGVPANPALVGYFGGYLIGDYEVEYYMAWLNTVGRSLPITLPRNLALFNMQLSVINNNPSSPLPLIWY